MGFFSACISAFLGNESQVTLSRNWGLNGIYIVVIEDFPFNLFLYLQMVLIVHSNYIYDSTYV